MVHGDDGVKQGVCLPTPLVPEENKTEDLKDSRNWPNRHIPSRKDDSNLVLDERAGVRAQVCPTQEEAE